MTPASLRRLLADLPGAANDHPIDAGLLGEYALLDRQRGPDVAAETYPHVAAHLRVGCQPCQDDLAELSALARRSGSLRGDAQSVRARPGLPGAPVEQATEETISSAIPEPLEISEAVALARAIEAERDALRAPLRPDRSGVVDSRRQTARRRQLLLVESALIRQRLVARRLFLNRAQALLAPVAPAPAPASERSGERRTSGRLPNPKAHLLLDDFAGHVDDLARRARRVNRLAADLRRLGDDPHGPARSQAEALVERGLSMTREALGVDQRLARLHGPLAGMLT